MKKSKNTVKTKNAFSDNIRNWFSYCLPGFALFAFLIIWEAVVDIKNIEKWILPSPVLIIQSFWESRQLLWFHSIQTITEALIGLGIAVVLGVIIATFIEWSIHFKKIVYPFLVISQTIPIIAIAPLLIIWFGYGLLPKIIVIALVCFFPITINLADGYRLVDGQMIRLLYAMGAKKHQVFRMVKIPASMPSFFSGFRIAGTYCVLGAVISEWLGASKGLGVFLTRSSKSYMTDRVFAIILVITALSLLVFAVIEGISRITIPWHYRKTS